MITENLSTLKIHKLTQAQYDREFAAGRIDENALYLTPDEGSIKDYITPQMFGAKGDGRTDDTAAIKAAMATLAYGDTLYFPKGSYLVSEPFSIDEGIIIQGAGIDFTNICVEDEAQINGYVFSFTEPQKGGGICDLTIKNSIDAIHSNASGLYIGAATERLASNFKCHHVKIICMVNGLYYDKLWEAYFDHIFIMNCSDTGFIIAGADTEFSNMNISKCKCGMHVGSGTAKICNLKIDNCNTGSIDEYALRIYGSDTQITNAEVQFCYPSGVIVTSPNNVLDLRIDGIGMDALYNFREAGYYFRAFDNCKNNNIKLAIITHDNNETLDYIHDDSHLFEHNTVEIVSNANIPLWYSSKKCYSELTGNVYNEKTLSELKDGNYLVECTYSADTNVVESDDTQIGIRLMQYLHPNIESNLYSAYVKVITDKPMANPFFWYTDNVGANNKCIKLKEREFGAKYETVFALYSEKTTNAVQALYLKSTENVKFKLYDIKFAIFGEIVDYKHMM